jgi:hypothetical protein
VGFANRPVQVPGQGTFVIPNADILALEPNQPLSTNNVSATVRQNPSSPSPFTLWQIISVPPIELLSSPGTVFTSTSCTPTFAQPCGIDYGIGTFAVQHRQIEDLFD